MLAQRIATNWSKWYERSPGPKGRRSTEVNCGKQRGLATQRCKLPFSPCRALFSDSRPGAAGSARGRHNRGLGRLAALGISEQGEPGSPKVLRVVEHFQERVGVGKRKGREKRS